MRQVVLDTETTGLEPQAGHRIIEIGAVELAGRRLTGHRFHHYLNPEREIDEGAREVHGIDEGFLADKPRFANIAGELLAFLEGAELVIHNAAFDLAFLNAELGRVYPERPPLEDHLPVVDTLALARERHPGQRNSLDALCARYGVDNSRRELHGALLDAELLAEVFLAMTGGQAALELEVELPGPEPSRGGAVAQRIGGGGGGAHRPRPPVVRASASERRAHAARLAALSEREGGQSLWTSLLGMTSGEAGPAGDAREEETPS